MRNLALLAVLAGALLATASASAQTTTLLTPGGQPVGGQWQRWMNDSYMPTYQGSMVLDLSPKGGCGSETYGCTAAHAFTPTVTTEVSAPETLISLGDTPSTYRRWALLYEQGHMIDFCCLTDTDRRDLLTMWGVRSPPVGETLDEFWWQGEQTLNQGTPVMGEWFSEAYALCALYPAWSWNLVWRTQAGNYKPYAPFIEGLPIARAAAKMNFMTSRTPTHADLVALRSQIATCGLIRSIVS